MTLQCCLCSLDRETDLISPLVTPLTYEGLVDDTFGIENGKIAVDSSILGTEDVELGKGSVAARGRYRFRRIFLSFFDW